MGTDKRQRAIAKRLKRKDARERGKARDRREANKAIRQERSRPTPLFDEFVLSKPDDRSCFNVIRRKISL
jgi:hypothetical protein